jgi:class 3 adenylate cyclase
MAEWPEPGQQRPAPPGGGLEERVADADRDRTITMLREHVVEGRLTLDEFSERTGLALEARTRGDLESVMANLPTVAPTSATTPEIVTGRKARRWHVAVMSGSDTKGRWRISGKTNAIAVMGGCEMDLRRAEIESAEIVINAFAFWGGIKIIVPEGFDVDLEGFSFMGGRSLRMADVPLVPGSPRIRIRGFAMMGGIEVRSRPNRSSRQVVQSVLEGVQGVIGALPERSMGGPEIDFAALGADIRRQIRSYHQGGRHHRDVVPPRGPSAPPEQPPVSTGQPLPSDGTVTILFSDMVDYAGMTERLGDQTSREVLREHHRIVRHMLDRHGGREINVQGDGFMVAFGGVARALRCAVDVQRAFRSYSEANLDRPIQVHIGVHTGDAVQEDDDFLGHTVIVASRLAAAAQPGEILVSSLSEQLVQGTGEFTFIEHRESVLKGLSRAQHAAALAWAD